MPIVLNLGPMPVSCAFGGYGFEFKPGERKRITSYKHNGETLHGEDIVQHLIANWGVKGLVLVDEDNPLPLDHSKRLARKTFVDWVRGQVDELNALNQKQAGQNLPVVFPTKEMRELQKHMAIIAKEIDIEGSEFVSSDELDAISKKNDIKAMQTLRHALAALESGDPEAAKAALKQNLIEPDRPGLPVEPPMAVGQPDPANDPTDPAPETDFTDPEKPIGTGMGRIPTRTGKRRG